MLCHGAPYWRADNSFYPDHGGNQSYIYHIALALHRRYDWHGRRHHLGRRLALRHQAVLREIWPAMINTIVAASSPGAENNAGDTEKLAMIDI